MTFSASIGQILDFIRANDTNKRAFPEWTDKQIITLLQDWNTKKYMTFDERGNLVSLVIADLTGGQFNLKSIVIREDVRCRGHYLASLVQQFLRFYHGLPLVTNRRGKRVELKPETLFRLCAVS